MNPTAPPPDNKTPWNWIGEDALQAGVLGTVNHFWTQRPDNDRWVAWFQKTEHAYNGVIYTPLVDFLLSVGCDVYLVIYKDKDNPVRIVNMKDRTRSKEINQDSLRRFMTHRGYRG